MSSDELVRSGRGRRLQHVPSISVALCTHNGARYLREQVRSICAQSLMPDEIVLSDDASTDASIEIVMEECASGAVAGRPNLHILRNLQPLGVSSNFEQAVRSCKGQLIALCDQDDIWRHDRMERVVREFSHRPGLQLLHSNARLVDRGGAALGTTLFQALALGRMELEWLHGGRAFDVLMRRNVVTGATTVFRRSLLLNALPFPPTWLHDEWLAAIAACTAEIDVLEETLIDYRQHACNLVGARRLRWRDAIRLGFASRGKESAVRAAKAAALLERVKALVSRHTPIDKRKLVLLQRKWRHQQVRASLPASRIPRIPVVVCEVVRGNYSRCGPGLRVAIADLVQQA